MTLKTSIQPTLNEPAGKTISESTPATCTELVAENERLRQKEAQLRALFNACYDGIFLVDADRYRIIEVNEPGLRLLGYTREELGELTVADLFPYEGLRFLDFACKRQRSGRRQSHELTCRTRSGELIPVQLLASALTCDDRSCLQLMVHDMREHRLAQLGLAVSKIAHDLRNILATAQLVADRVAASRDPECQRITPRLIAAIDRAIGLCTQTLTHGRATQPSPRYAACRLRPLVEDVAATSNVNHTARIVWRNEIAPDFELTVDPDQLFRVLLNLVRNAREALLAKGSGDICVSAARADGKVVLEVADTGPGVPRAVRARLFEPFANFGRPSSTGLGLVIARELMRGHGGDVTLARSDGEGTVFRLELPERPGV